MMKAPAIIEDVHVIAKRDDGLVCRVAEREVLVPLGDVCIAVPSRSQDSAAGSSSRAPSPSRSAC